MYTVKRPDDEVDDVLNRAAEAEDEGTTQWKGMTYEQGVAAGIRWLVGDSDDNPLEG